MSAIDRLRQRLAEFEKDPESIAIELQTQFAGIILRELKRKRWTQRQLAQATGIHETKISPIVHGDVNCTLETLARISSALGIRLHLNAVANEMEAQTTSTTDGLTIQAEEATHGEEITQEESTIDGGPYRFAEYTTGHTGNFPVRSAQG